MWKRGGRSFALDRAQVLLSAKRNNRGGVKSVQGATVHTGAVDGAVKTRFSSLNTHPSLSDLSEPSSVSSAPEHGADTLGSAAAKTQRRDGDSTKDLRPQSSLGGGGSRFLKKAPPPATNSSQSPVSKSQINASSSQQGSQTAALRRLAHIESHNHSGMQVQEHSRQGQKPVENLTSDVGILPAPVSHSLEAPVQLSAQSSSDTSLMRKRFLKNVTTVAVDSSKSAAARPPKEADFRVRSIAADAVVTSGGLEKKSVRVVSGVSLESDEEVMKKLLGDSLDSIDNNFSIPGRRSFRRRADELLSKTSKKAYASPLPATISPSSSPAPPHSPAYPSRHSSPFQFIGQTQAHFSPSVLSVSPSPSCVSPSPPLSRNSPHKVGSPQRPLLSMSCHDEVLSLEELFVGPDSEYPHSEMSAVTSEDLKINVMTLEDLVPATLEFTEETPGIEREVKQSVPLLESPNRHQQQLRYKEKEKKEEEQQEGALDYQNDFESESKTKSKYSVNQISEHLQEDGDEETVVPEVREEDSDVSCERTEDNYLSTFSDTGRSCTSQTPGHSHTCRSRDSRLSVSHDSRSLTRKSRSHALTRLVLKEAEVQTQPIQLGLTRRAGMATLSPTMDLTPVVAHTLSAEMVEALSTFNPAVFTLNEMLKQQLAMTRCFIERGRHLHSSLVQSLGPPNYRYTMLEDTKEYICKHRPPRLTMEEALEEVLQEMRDSHI